ncbi:hypothetical protein Goshw_011759 [Gossypium schwendimanii]|uniref:RNase H type-1 domain-containing protein n=1 Tax=Gossypium schwendimanii TaxID=34291 RepID=A0A7J9MN01_GOSSC|nr:hypothetical protein [Gossypium schwendimanii]
MSLVGLDSICQPKWCSGLGLKRLRDQNISFLLKLGFNIVSNKDVLWVHVLRSKYHLKKDLPDYIARNRSSFLWRSLSKVWLLLHENLFWSFRDGNKIQCWRDNWIPIVGPLFQHISNNVIQDSDCLLNEMITKDGSWNLDLFQNPKDEKWKSVWKLPGPQRDWLRANLQNNNMVHEEGSSWACLFGLLIWRLWKNRNLFIFQGQFWSSMETVQVSLSWVNQLFSALSANFKGNFKPPVEKESFEDPIFLNIDGALQLGSGNAATGGVVRDANGDWIFGYNRRLEKCSIFNAKLWGILEGLKLIQRRGHDEVIIQSDSFKVVKVVLESTSTETNSALIRRMQSILFQEKRWLLRYISRDQNQVANCLAKQALIGTNNLQVFDAPHLMTSTLMELDKNKNIFFFRILLCN